MCPHMVMNTWIHSNREGYASEGEKLSNKKKAINWMASAKELFQYFKKKAEVGGGRDTNFARKDILWDRDETDLNYICNTTTQ